MVKIVELVETNLLRKSPGNAVRHLESEALCKILNELYDIIKLFCESENIQLGDKEETLSKSLYMWHGCLNMDKLCRKKDILGEVITEQYRIEIHNWLVELSQSNIWIGKGFRAAEKFRLDQKNDKEYDWIPKDSPYYQSM